ncbi:NUDIX hydrolase [Truepera radiovictrix]|uniref:NUDIX hydrolase n=1 Tax=Truepera radiovictrix (strain DSM 17093 / CIP 108686 / LMG 22925 / RQ-24) TaxID=649638 RepID=D7CT54_TRURR|nr:NUDIX domain-containing protein [Truepera radiovictrix]ADI15517.1 NUDIX hydrolase [Truepera radiovictrix DSM 17093]WMT55932.1 NUDIX domain-containing protein [Truepera radiovictrix]
MALTRDFTATAFVVWRNRVLLHRHKKLGLWFPCGGHLEPNELPDEAAVREVFEESGVRVVLVGERALQTEPPRQLVRPRGVQLERIAEGHEHIDLIYFARPVAGYSGALLPSDPTLGWYDADALSALELTDEIREWTALALRELGEAVSEGANP